MFTGIISAVGTLVSEQQKGGDVRLRVSAGKLDMSDVRHGDSIASNGVCLTVVDYGADWYSVDASRETLALTTLGQLQPGSKLNLEKALALGDRLGGHLVSGHVDGVGEVISRYTDARSTRFRIRAPENLSRYIAHKGSICIDGVSLTVNKVEGPEFELNIIPVTMEETIFDAYQAGSQVNLEVDQIARYLERLLLGEESEKAGEGISHEFLERHGYRSR